MTGVQTCALPIFGGNLSVSNSTQVGNLSITNATASSSSTTGALIVSGGVGIGGKIYAASDITSAGLFYATDGSSSNPSIVFTSSPTTGFYSAGSGKVGVSSQLTFQSGTVGAPPISWANDSTSGIYRAANPTQMGFVIGGAEKVRLDNKIGRAHV